MRVWGTGSGGTHISLKFFWKCLNKNRSKAMSNILWNPPTKKFLFVIYFIWLFFSDHTHTHKMIIWQLWWRVQAAEFRRMWVPNPNSILYCVTLGKCLTSLGCNFLTCKQRKVVMRIKRSIGKGPYKCVITNMMIRATIIPILPFPQNLSISFNTKYEQAFHLSKGRKKKA